MKFEKPEMSIVRFNESEAIVTSCVDGPQDCTSVICVLQCTCNEQSGGE